MLVDSRIYLGVARVSRIKKQLAINVSDQCYQPRLADLRNDWVAHIAAPAFKVYHQQRGGGAVDSFCSIGTGSGLDVLAAVEILQAGRVGLTDVHAEVVNTAVANIANNHNAGIPLTIEAGYGDLLKPLRSYGTRYAVIYENLPNVPAISAEEVAAARNSGTYVPPRRESLPELVRRQMLDLHYLALVQARDFLYADGVIFSCLGARVPLQVFLSMGELADYRSSFLTYGWKLQGDPELVIRDHAKSQAQGFGPFYFYRAEVLQNTFAQIAVNESGARALEIERELFPHRLDAATAYAAFKDGESIGHTVAFLQSQPK